MPYIGKSPEFGVRQRYYFTQSSGGGTSVSGTDDNGITLKFSDGNYVDVFLNGVLLVDGTDYGTSTANTIDGLSALAASDVVEVIVYDVFNFAKNQAEVTRTRYYKTASGSETSISGNDDSGVAIEFPAGAQLDVSLNGVSLVAGSDYNTSTANTISGLSALSAGNVIEIVKYEKFVVSDTVSKAAGGTFGGDVSTTGDFKPTGKEYFHVDLTSSQSGLGDDTAHVVDFGGSGTVKYDTKSNFDSANDAYLLDSSDGVYLISYSVAFKSVTLTSEKLQDAGAVVRIATDGTTFADVNGNGAHLMNDASNEIGSVTLSGSFIYKSTTATTKVHLHAYAQMAGSNYTINHQVNQLLNNVNATFGTTARPTFLSIVRIA